MYLPLGPMDLLLRDRQDRNSWTTVRPVKSSTRPGGVTSFRKTAGSIFGAYTPSVCSVICSPPFTGAACLPARAGDTPIRGANLLSDAEWEAIVCRTLGLPPTAWSNATERFDTTTMTTSCIGQHPRH